MPLLHSKSFESRTAASVALSQIFSLVPVWSPSSAGDAQIQTSLGSLDPPDFPTFSIKDLLEKGNLLLASSGKEFSKPAGILSSAQEVQKARKDAMARLGLGFLETVEDDMDLDKEFAADMDLDPTNTPHIANGAESTTASSPMDLCPTDMPSRKDPSPSTTRSVTPNLPPAASALSETESSALSARERNRLKRKRKPGNAAFVAPPPQSTGAKYAVTATGTANKSVFHTCAADIILRILTEPD